MYKCNVKWFVIVILVLVGFLVVMVGCFEVVVDNVDVEFFEFVE